MSEQLLLAADGGNSKTDLAVFTGTGELLGCARGPGSSPQSHGVEGSLRLLDDLRHRVVASAPRAAGPLLAAAYAMTGLDLPEEEQAFAAAVAGHAAHVEACNDIFAVLRAGSENGGGVAVVAGAGINCVGMAEDGRRVRFHSLGRLSGDWGGGIDLGEEALGAACRHEDGRGPRTALHSTVPRYFALDRPLQVAEAVHRGELGRHRLAELAPLVMAASGGGDVVATGLLDRLAAEVAAFVGAAVTRLGPSRGETPVVLAGGLLQAGSQRLTTRIEAALAAAAPAAVVQVLRAAPVVGSALLAADLAGLAEPARDRIRAELAAATDRGRTRQGCIEPR